MQACGERSIEGETEFQYGCRAHADGWVLRGRTKSLKPGSMSSFRRHPGRAGPYGRRSITRLVARRAQRQDDVLDRQLKGTVSEQPRARDRAAVSVASAYLESRMARLAGRERLTGARWSLTALIDVPGHSLDQLRISIDPD